MCVELREIKWRGMLGIEKVGVEGCWMFLTIYNGLRMEQLYNYLSRAGSEGV